MVGIVQRKLRMLESAADRNANSDVSHVGGSLPRLSDGVNRANIECRIQIGSAEETQASALYVECRLNERINEIEPISPANGVECSLERQLRRFARLRIGTKRDVERSAQLHVRFRRAEPHRITDVYLYV